MENSVSYVAYLRVSSRGQGLGLDAQLTKIHQSVGSESVIKTFSEKVSGCHECLPLRKELEAAIKFCRVSGSTLVVAKLDRLGRDLADISSICFHQGVKVIALDVPPAVMDNPMLFGVFAGMAQEERSKIRQRVSDAMYELKTNILPAMKTLHMGGNDAEAEAYWLAHKSPRSRVTYAQWVAKGFKLGTPRTFTEDDVKSANKTRKEIADAGERNMAARDAIIVYLAGAVDSKDRSLRKIADYLNGLRIKTPRGGQHGAKSVQLVCQRYGIEWK